MNVGLKKYTVPREFKAIFDHNYSIVNSIEDNRSIRSYVQYLADSSQIDFDVVLLDLKNYILVAQQYYPHYVKQKLINILFFPYFIINALNKIRLIKIKPKKELIIDDWFEASSEGFYGLELVAQLKANWTTLITNFNSLGDIGLKVFIKTLPAFAHSFFHATFMRNVDGIDLRRYTYSFYTKVMKGKTIATYYRPKLVVSGNDNGLFTVAAKAAGADVLLIHNGVRWPYFSEFCFKYADYIVSMEAEEIFRIRMNQGCSFKHSFFLGSLRLYNFVQQNGKTDLPLLYDVLWVSTYTDICIYDSPLNGYYLATDEHKAIRVFNNLVETYLLKTAYQCRYASEVKDLKKLGLFNEKVTYIEVGTQSVYRSVAESKIVLSSWSTACHEAMALGKKVGFVNLSGNEYINILYKDLEIEYTGEDNNSLEDFFLTINTNKFDQNRYIKQSASYVDELTDIVDRAITSGQSIS